MPCSGSPPEHGTSSLQLRGRGGSQVSCRGGVPLVPTWKNSGEEGARARRAPPVSLGLAEREGKAPQRAELSRGPGSLCSLWVWAAQGVDYGACCVLGRTPASGQADLLRGQSVTLPRNCPLPQEAASPETIRACHGHIPWPRLGTRRPALRASRGTG